MAYDFEVSDVVAAPPDTVYRAWMSGEEHSAMTGATAHIDPQVSGEFDAWDGYIHGTTVTLEPFSRIVQTWRTANFTDEHTDSAIEVLFEPEDSGTRVRVRHTNVPEDQLGYEDGGWQKSYFDPMKAYFAER
jgi:activator of HSP90 ATPase